MVGGCPSYGVLAMEVTRLKKKDEVAVLVLFVAAMAFVGPETTWEGMGYTALVMLACMAFLNRKKIAKLLSKKAPRQQPHKKVFKNNKLSDCLPAEIITGAVYKRGDN